MRSLETLQDAYDAWLELRLEHAQARRQFKDEQARLTQQGQFLVGAVRSAGAPSSKAGLVRPGGLESFLGQAEEKLAQAGQALKVRAEADELAFEQAFSSIRQQVRERVERFSARVRPRLSLMVRHLGADRRIVHLARVGGDEAVLLLWVLARRIPSRYGFLFDDATDQMQLAPPTLYPEEGVEESQVRPGPGALLEQLQAQGEVLPVKGFIPALVAREGGEALYRLLQRGPVMEVEIAEGEGFRNLLEPGEAEAFAGHLLRLKLSGEIELELDPG